jgi:hypothetical protein
VPWRPQSRYRGRHVLKMIPAMGHGWLRSSSERLCLGDRAVVARWGRKGGGSGPTREAGDLAQRIGPWCITVYYGYRPRWGWRWKRRPRVCAANIYVRHPSRRNDRRSWMLHFHLTLQPPLLTSPEGLILGCVSVAVRDLEKEMRSPFHAACPLRRMRAWP